MAEEEAKVVDAMPPPPAYYKLFAPDAAKATAASASNSTESAPASPAVPSPLPTVTSSSTSTPAPAGDADDGFPLKPPPPPGPEETFKMFGMPYSTNPVSEELLPPEKMVVPTSGQQTDFRAEMKTLLNSIMANYGQFMEMLICSPSRAHEKVSDLETLFVNFHSLLNRYRAHQARHIILERLRSQVAENVAAISALESAMRESILARERASACLRAPNGTLAAIGVPMDVSDGDVARESWREMEGLDGALAVGGVVGQGHAQAQWPVSLTGNGHEVGSMVHENLRREGGGSTR